MASSSSSNLTFNDLPSDVQSVTFHHLTALERAMILPTCQQWYQLIMGSQAYWRILLSGEDCSFERLIKMLQAFTERSQGTLNGVVADRKIEDSKEMEQIYEILALSSSNLKFLSIRQGVSLNTQSRVSARILLPNLGLLNCSQEAIDSALLAALLSRARWFEGLWYYDTNQLFAMRKDDLEWFSHLKLLRFSVTDSIKSVHSILKRNPSTLDTLDWTFVDGSEAKSSWIDPVVMQALFEAALPTQHLEVPALVLPLVAPKLNKLTARISQLKAVDAPSVVQLMIQLEEEDEAWVANHSGSFLREVRAALLRFPSVRFLAILAFTSPGPIQIGIVVQTLHCSGNETPLVPQLEILHLRPNYSTTETDGLVDLFISRHQYREKKGEDEAFRLCLVGPENQLLFDEALRKRQDS